MTTTRCLAAHAAALALLVPAAPLHAFDLTGTWEGTASCKSFFEGTASRAKVSVAIEISQSGDSLAVRLGGFSFNGRALEDADNADKGEVVLSLCGTDDLPLLGRGTLVRARASTRPESGAGKLQALLITDDSNPVPLVSTCKWRLERTATADPSVAPCP
jgi:hypothetical protein